MPRRNNRRKPRRWLPNEEPTRPLTPEEMARSIVARGLASPQILADHRPDRTNHDRASTTPETGATWTRRAGTDGDERESFLRRGTRVDSPASDLPARPVAMTRPGGQHHTTSTPTKEN